MYKSMATWPNLPKGLGIVNTNVDMDWNKKWKKIQEMTCK